MDLNSWHYRNVILFLFLDLFNRQLALDIWTEYKSSQKYLSWDASPTTDIVFRSEYTSITKCAFECSHNDACNLMLIHQDHCYGLLNYTDTGTGNPLIKVYFKQRKTCPPDFMYIEGWCLFVSTFKLSWFEAKDYCENQNGVLMSLDTESKHTMFKQLLQKYFIYGNDHFYVGASDIQQEGTWTWLKSGSQNYFAWRAYQNQPNNADVDFPGEVADCGCLNTVAFGLIDEYCYQTKRFICEI